MNDVQSANPSDELLSLARTHLPSGEIVAWAVAQWGTAGTTLKNAATKLTLGGLLGGAGLMMADLEKRKAHIGVIGVAGEQFFVADFGVITGTPPLDAIRSLFKEEPSVETFPLSKLHASCTTCTDVAVAGSLWIHGNLQREFSLDKEYRTGNVAQGAKIANAITPGSGSSSCFIATACWGSPDCPEVVVLRQFRDDILMRSHLGSLCVRLYYRISPPVAHVLRRVPLLATTVRACLLRPIVEQVSRRWTLQPNKSMNHDKQ